MKSHNVHLEELRNIYGKISPFEFKDRLIHLANGQKEKSAHTLLEPVEETQTGQLQHLVRLFLPLVNLLWKKLVEYGIWRPSRHASKRGNC